MTDEATLLAEYVATGSQAAFAQLTGRYVDMVYSAARRQVRDEHLAEDVTQAVFLVLAQRARAIRADGPLSGWLLKVTSYCAANARRTRARREAHEQRAAEMTSKDQSEQHWTTLAPLLDEGLAKLGQADRNALLLRFFEHKTLQQVGEALGISQDAAQKRVTRAVGRLRVLIVGRDATAMSAAAISELLSTHAVATAPPGLATSVASATAGANSAMLAKGATIIMATQKVKLIAATAAVLILGIGGGTLAIKHFVDQPRQADARNVATDSARNGSTSWPLTFADGTQVDILAISDAAAPGKWWLPDGSPASNPFMPSETTPTNQGSSSARRIEFVVRHPKLSDARRVMIRMLPRDVSSGRMLNRPGETLVYYTFEVPRELKSADFLVGLSTSEWQNTLEWDVTQPPPTTAMNGIKISGLSEENGKTILNASALRFGSPALDEYWAVVVNGKEVRAQSYHTSALAQLRCEFRAAKGDVQKVIYRSRPFEVMQLKGVSLQQNTPTGK